MSQNGYLQETYMNTYPKLFLKLFLCLSFLLGGANTTWAIKINNAKHFYEGKHFDSSCILSITKNGIIKSQVVEIPAGQSASLKPNPLNPKEICKNCSLQCQVKDFSTNTTFQTNTLSTPPEGWPETQVFFFTPNLDHMGNFNGFILDTPHKK
jgi:hypothetical protein